MGQKKVLRFLVIDDNEITRAALRTIINSCDGCMVAGEAGNGESGLEMAHRLQPDVVCLDIVMPHLGGMDVLEKLRSAHSKSMVIMITASNDAQTVQAAVKFGVAGFIVKPFNAGTVLDTLEHVVERWRAANL